MTTMNISLPDSMRVFIEQKVAQNGYSTASEYIRQLVRDAQKVFLPTWEQTHGNDGYVSFEVDPLLEDPALNVAHSVLPRSVQRAIDQAPVRPGRWRPCRRSSKGCSRTTRTAAYSGRAGRRARPH